MNDFKLENNIQFNKKAKEALIEILKNSKLIEKNSYSYKFKIPSKYDKKFTDIVNLVTSPDSLIFDMFSNIKNEKDGSVVADINSDELYEATKIIIYDNFEKFLDIFFQFTGLKNKEDIEKMLKNNLIYNEKGKYKNYGKEIYNLLKTKKALEELGGILYVSNIFVPYIKNNKPKVSKINFETKEYKDLYHLPSLKAKEIYDILVKLDKQNLTFGELYKKRYPNLKIQLEQETNLE